MSYRALVRVAPAAAAELRRRLGHGVVLGEDRADRVEQDGWCRLALNFESLEDARGALLGLGRGVEVLEPLALRLSVLDYARQVVALYRSDY